MHEPYAIITQWLNSCKAGKKTVNQWLQKIHVAFYEGTTPKFIKRKQKMAVNSNTAL